MQSVLISSKNKDEALKKALEIAKTEKIDKFDIAIIDSPTLGIEDVRTFQKNVFLKPIKSLSKMVILNGGQNITHVAQNALLKVLEEPPANTIIILLVENKESILPTILSRCSLIELNADSKNQLTEYLKVLGSLSSTSGIGERLKLAQDLSKNKQEAMEFLEGMIMTTREQLYKKADNNKLLPIYFRYLTSLQRTHTWVKTTNVNLRLALENLFINL